MERIPKGKSHAHIVQLCIDLCAAASVVSDDLYCNRRSICIRYTSSKLLSHRIAYRRDTQLRRRTYCILYLNFYTFFQSTQMIYYPHRKKNRCKYIITCTYAYTYIPTCFFEQDAKLATGTNRKTRKERDLSVRIYI